MGCGLSQLKQRDDMVYEAALEHGSKLVVTMGGGYPKVASTLHTKREEKMEGRAHAGHAKGTRHKARVCFF